MDMQVVAGCLSIASHEEVMAICWRHLAQFVWAAEHRDETMHLDAATEVLDHADHEQAHSEKRCAKQLLEDRSTLRKEFEPTLRDIASKHPARKQRSAAPAAKKILPMVLTQPAANHLLP